MAQTSAKPERNTELAVVVIIAGALLLAIAGGLAFVYVNGPPGKKNGTKPVDGQPAPTPPDQQPPAK